MPLRANFTNADLAENEHPNHHNSLADAANRLAALQYTVASSALLTLPGVMNSNTAATRNVVADTDVYQPFLAEDRVTFDQVLMEVTTAGASGNCRVALYAANQAWQPTGTLIEDFGSFSTNTTGVKTLTPAGGSRAIAAGRYLMAYNVSVATTFRCLRGSLASCLINPPLGTAMTCGELSVARTHGAFPSTALAWTTVMASAVGYQYTTFLRVTAVG